MLWAAGLPGGVLFWLSSAGRPFWVPRWRVRSAGVPAANPAHMTALQQTAHAHLEQSHAMHLPHAVTLFIQGKLTWGLHAHGRSENQN